MPQSRDLFVDTSGWVSYLNQGDSQHTEAVMLCQTAVKSGRKLVTPNYIIAELVALLTARLHLPRPQLIRVIDLLKAMPQLEIVHVTPDLDTAAWDLLKNRIDKEWSLVDATSFTIMSNNGMSEALTTDHHFTQAGFVRLLTR